MKTKKQDINLRQLFANRLENAEVDPEQAVRAKLMRRVARKEFMRFNPSKLNIYYLSGILITGFTLGVLIFTAPKASRLLKSTNTPSDVIRIDSNNFIELPVAQPVRKKQEKEIVTRSESVHKKLISHPDESNLNVIIKKSVEAQKSEKTFTGNVSSALTKKGILPTEEGNDKKLQRGFNAEAFLIEPYSSAGCAPLKVKFHNMSITYDSCRWTFGDGGYSNERDPEWIFDIEGEYKIVLQVFTSDGRIFSSTATVTVHPRPTAHFEISPEKAVLPNDEIHFMNFSTNAIQSKWYFGDGTTSEYFEPTHTYSKFGNYDVRLIVFSEWGCSDSLVIYNAYSGSQYFIDFPNAFIPNTQGPTGGYYSLKSDEAAQVFHPSFSGITDYQLKIFSKLGIPIFESSDISLGWDGYHKGQLCDPGVYIWKVRGKFRNGEPFIKMGDVILLKN